MPSGGRLPAMPEPITFFNRLTQRLETEAVHGERPLRFVYEHPLGKLALAALVKRTLFSRWYGRRMDSARSAALIPPFIEKYGIDVTEFADPVGSFRTFNDFFTRRLKPGARPIAADPRAVILPADGRHRVIVDAAKYCNFLVKGIRFDLGALLADPLLAREFDGASVLISRLCPTDYHRCHFPCAGRVGTPRWINGPLYSVNPIALARRPAILWENKRCITPLQTETMGRVLLIEVGATCVGSIVHTTSPGQAVRKGDEMGFFRFGGSCLISVFEQGRVRFADDLLEHSAAGREVYARMGDVAGIATAA